MTRGEKVIVAIMVVGALLMALLGLGQLWLGFNVPGLGQ